MKTSFYDQRKARHVLFSSTWNKITKAIENREKEIYAYINSYYFCAPALSWKWAFIFIAVGFKC